MHKIKSALMGPRFGSQDASYVPVTTDPDPVTVTDNFEPTRTERFMRQSSPSRPPHGAGGAGHHQPRDHYYSQQQQGPPPSLRQRHASYVSGPPPTAGYGTLHSSYADDQLVEGRPIDMRAAHVAREAQQRRQSSHPAAGSVWAPVGDGPSGPLRISSFNFTPPQDRTDAPPMEQLRRAAQDRYLGASELRSEPQRTTQLHRPYVDDRGVQHYNPSVYAAALAQERTGQDRQGAPDGTGRPLQLPRANADGTPAHFGPTRAYADDRISAPIASTAAAQGSRDRQDAVRNRHHAFGVPENVPKDLPGMSPFEVDFSWSTAEEPPHDNFQSYLKSTLVPRDDRVFRPGTAASRGFAASPARGSSAGGSERRTSPLRFRGPRRASPSPQRSSALKPGGAVGLQPGEKTFAERYSHRGWTHLERREAHANERVDLAGSPTISTHRAHKHHPHR